MIEALRAEAPLRVVSRPQRVYRARSDARRVAGRGERERLRALPLSQRLQQHHLRR
jgi:hypothetical protein